MTSMSVRWKTVMIAGLEGKSVASIVCLSIHI